MPNPSSSGADAAYERAAEAFSAQSYDVARRWVLEALAQHPEHAGARALLARLDATRRPPTATPRPSARSSPFGVPSPPPGPEAVSTDPTVLISRADHVDPPEGIEPTVLIRRDEPRRASTPVADPFRAPSPRQPFPDVSHTPEPTIIRPAAPPPPPPPRSGTPRRSPPAAAGGFLQRFKDLFGGPRVPASTAKPRAASGPTPGMRGAALAIGGVVVAALLLGLGYMGVRWMWPGGVELAFDRPTGGTIRGAGLECGSKGKDCSTTTRKGETVELDVQPDPNFVFGGFTGDCPDSGRLVMNGARKCGATFNPLAASSTAAAVTFALTVTKPQGGSLTAEGVILCGTLGNDCSASVPSGAPVRMGFQADNNFTFQSYTGDCAPNGEMLMNAAKTCGAIFMPTPGATVVNRAPEVAPPVKRPPPARKEDAPPAHGTSAADTAQGPPAPPVPQVAPPVVPQVAPTVTGPVKEAISAEDHAKQEIEDLVKRYCSANETLKPENVQKLFPLAPMATYRHQFHDYQTLKCTTSKPEFQRLDARDTGGAQVLFDMKQVIQMKSGGAPKVFETKVTMVVSRTGFQAPWLIDRLVAEEKPK